MGGEVLESILEAPVRELCDPFSRLFLGHLIGAAALGALISWLRGGSLFRSWRWLVRSIGHKSFRKDLRLFLSAAIVSALLAPGLSHLGREGAIVSARLLRGTMSLEGALHTSAFAVLLFVLDDFTRYLLHRALHTIPLLWRFHRVHHSAVVMTPLTFKRQYPVEVVLFGLRYALVVACVGGIFFSLSGRFWLPHEWGPGASTVFVLYLVSSNLRHSHVRIGWGRKLEALLISPAQHQIHHGRERWMQNSNYGSTLAVWDLLCGSLVRSEDAHVTRFGLVGQGRNRSTNPKFVR